MRLALPEPSPPCPPEPAQTSRLASVWPACPGVQACSWSPNTHNLEALTHAAPAGKDFVHQLNMVCKVVGTPSAGDIAAVTSDKARAYLASMPYFPKGGECAPACTPGLHARLPPKEASARPSAHLAC